MCIVNNILRLEKTLKKCYNKSVRSIKAADIYPKGYGGDRKAPDTFAAIYIKTQGDIMKNIITITDLDASALAPYRITNEVQLLRYFEPEMGVFIAESPKVIRRALDAGYEPMSMLVSKKLLSGKIDDILSRVDCDVYTADESVLTSLTGFKLTQGALCAMRRKPVQAPYETVKNATLIAVLEDICNQTNVGAIFRSAAAMGVDAVLLTRACSDPLYRRSVRVSMGTVFQIPWSYLESPAPDYINELKALGFKTAAMALRDNTVDISDNRLSDEQRLAIVLGTEGEGLKNETIKMSDYCVKIPMHHGVDSLNVAAAGAVAFYAVRGKLLEVRN